MGQLEESRTPTVGYLGPPGTFTEQAIYSQPDLAAMNHRPINSIIDVLRAVGNGEVDLGLVAIENMIEGSVTATLDALAFDTDLFIQREVIIDVNLNLLGRPGTSLESVDRVRSYPVAHAQCRDYLAAHLPNAVFEAANSTADAARSLAESDDRTAAAIAPLRSAEVYGLEVLAADIADHPDNQTRFVLVGADFVAAPTGHDKTSMVIYQRSDVPGSLIGILGEFAARAINLTSLQSRPDQGQPGPVLLSAGLRGPHRRRGGGRRPAQPEPEDLPGEVPRLLPVGLGRPPRPRDEPGGDAQGGCLDRRPQGPHPSLMSGRRAWTPPRLSLAAEGWQSGRLRRS